MAKQIVTNSEENQELFKAALKVYKARIAKMKNKAEVNQSAENHPLFAIVSKMVAVQNASPDNLVSRSDITDSEYSKLNEYSKYRKVSIPDTLASLTTNLRYIARGKAFDIEANFAKAAENIGEVFAKYYRKRNQFPINALAPDVYKFLSNLESGLSIEKNIEFILREFHPELIKSEDEFAATSKASAIGKGEEMLQMYANLIRTKYCRNGNIDLLFSRQNEQFFVELSRFLKSQWITFDEFVNSYVCGNGREFDYTRCYTADSTKIGKKLMEYYVSVYGTSKHVQDTDPYLYTKLRSAMDALNIHEIGRLLDYWQVPNDNQESHNLMAHTELKMRELDFEQKINSKFGGVVPDKLKTIDRKTYETMTLLARRRGFASVDEYIESINLSRNKPASTATNKGVNFFSDYDLMLYRVFDSATTAEEIEDLMAEFDIRLIPADEKHIKTYRNMAFEQQDSRANMPQAKKFS